MGGRHREVFLEEVAFGLGQIPQLEEGQRGVGEGGVRVSAVSHSRLWQRTQMVL